MFNLALYDLPFFIAIGLIVILVQSDFFLTLKGYSLYKKYYAEYYKMESYELNPIWRKTVESGKKLNIKHKILTILMIILFAFVIQFNKEVYVFALGMILFAFLMINLLHLQNILIFLHFKTRKTDVQGHIEISLVMGLKQSSIVTITYAIFLFVAFLLTQSLILSGGVLGISAIALRLYFLYRKQLG